MPSTHNLGTFHRNLQRVYGIQLGRRLVLTHVGDAHSDLKKFRAGAVASFELIPADGSAEQAIAQGGRRFVYPLLPWSADTDEYNKPCCWVSWYDKWRCVEKNEFDLQEASWTVYWGYVGDEQKTQVVRAEWDQIHRLDRTPSNAGHPHWHVDTKIALSEIDAAVGLEAAADERQDDIGSQLSIQKVHLAMGGWRNPCSGETMPECWHCNFTGEVDEVVDWGERTLRYLQSQADFIRPQ